jgi:hypothetical protein
MDYIIKDAMFLLLDARATLSARFHFIVFKSVMYQKYFEIVNETTLKIHSFILEFYNTNFYIVPLVVYVIK